MRSRNGFRWHQLFHKQFGIAAQHACVGQFPLLQPFGSSSPLAIINFQSQIIDIRIGHGSIHKKQTTPTTDIQFDGVLILEEMIPTERFWNILQRLKVGKEIWGWSVLHNYKYSPKTLLHDKVNSAKTGVLFEPTTGC